MWSPDRRTLLLLPLVAGCGFTPAYGPEGAASTLRNRVATGEPNDRAEFDFVRQIEERLGRPQAPFWRLDYSIALQRDSVAITPENAVTRFNLTGRASWKLVPIAPGAKPLQGTAESFTSWSATGSTVAVLAAEEDAELRLMRILADQVATRLIAAAAQIAPAAPAP